MSLTAKKVKGILNRILFGVAFCASSILLLNNPLQAQVRFATPDTTIDLSKYTTIEECMALKNRLNARERRNLPYWKDSLEYTRTEKLDAQPAPVFDTLNMCMEKFSIANVDYKNYKEYLDWITVFYDIGRGDNAQAIIDTKLSTAKWDKEDTAGRHKVILDLLSPLESSRPMPWDIFVRTAKMIDSPEASSPWETRMSIYSSLMSLSEDVNDTVTQKYAAEKIVELTNTLTEADKINEYWKHNGRYYSLQALDFLHNSEMLDSLAVSSKAYIALRNSYWQNIRGQNSDNLPNNVGETAKPLTGDFWFKREGSSVVRLNEAPGPSPQPGSLNLIVFLEIRCTDYTPVFLDEYRREYPSNAMCMASYPVIRRLAERYPALRITVVSMTDGFIGLSEPMLPEEEAVQKSQWWLGTFRLPVTLIVAEQKFFKLPEPDGRRVDEIHSNTLNYSFGKNITRIQSGRAYLVDVDGTILFAEGLNPHTERQFNRLLRVITNRK